MCAEILQEYISRKRCRNCVRIDNTVCFLGGELVPWGNRDRREMTFVLFNHVIKKIQGM